MPVMDEFREEVAQIKHAPFKKRVEYFMDYYKWQTIAIILAVIVVVGISYDMITAKDEAFYALLLNSWQPDSITEEVSESFKESTSIALGINTKEEFLTLDDSMYMDYENQDANFAVFLQKLVTIVATQTVDVIATDVDTYQNLVQAEYYMDLYECLSHEEIKAYEDRFYYIDRAYYEDKERVQENINALYEFPEYDPTSKEGMKDPMAVGIYLREGDDLLEYYTYAGEAVIGIVQSTARLERAVEFLRLMIE